jgi:hypothetical protein
MPQRLELATEMMRTDAGLHADQARGHIGKACFDLATRSLLAQHDCATTIEPNDVERVLTDINADYGNRTLCCRSHGVLLGLAPLASLSRAGQEHGRTIPLPGIGIVTQSLKRRHRATSAQARFATTLRFVGPRIRSFNTDWWFTRERAPAKTPDSHYWSEFDAPNQEG